VKKYKLKREILAQLKKYGKDLKLWINQVRYALGVYIRENVMVRLKFYAKF
jgi:hypothetical protein